MEDYIDTTFAIIVAIILWILLAIIIIISLRRQKKIREIRERRRDNYVVGKLMDGARRDRRFEKEMHR